MTDTTRSSSKESDSNAEREFVAMLINLYRGYPELWLVKHKDYLSKKKRSMALQNMISVLEQYKPNYTEEQLKQKINVVRTNFNKEFNKMERKKQSGEDDIPEPTLWYFNDLMFIREQDNDSWEQPIQQLEILFGDQSGPSAQKKKKPTPVDTKVSSPAAHYSMIEDESDVLAKGWSIKLSRLSQDQRRFAEKIINDTLFEAEMGTLTRRGVQNVAHSLTNFLPFE